MNSNTKFKKNNISSPKEHISRLIKAFNYSLKGIKSAFSSEAAFRLEIYALIVLLPTAIFLPFSIEFKAILLFSTLIVPCIELLNSGLEAIVDRIGSEYHELSGKAKDVGSAAVLFSTVACLIVWICAIYSLLK